VPIYGKRAQIIEQRPLNPQIQARAALVSQLISVLSHTVLADDTFLVILRPCGS
jgi:hypothetical protein